MAYHYLAGLPYTDVAAILGGSIDAARRSWARPTATGASSCWGWACSPWRRWRAAWLQARSCWSPRESAQGSAAALMFPQALTGIQLHFTGLVRVPAIGRYAIALSAGAVTGQILGGALISANLAGTGWRAIFLINVPVGVLVLGTDSHWLPADDRRASRSLDVPGVAALSVAVLLLVLPLTLGQAEGWPGWAWACMAASVPAFAVFLSVERRAAARGGSPLVNVTAPWLARQSPGHC